MTVSDQLKLSKLKAVHILVFLAFYIHVTSWFSIGPKAITAALSPCDSTNQSLVIAGLYNHSDKNCKSLPDNGDFLTFTWKSSVHLLIYCARTYIVQ